MQGGNKYFLLANLRKNYEFIRRFFLKVTSKLQCVFRMDCGLLLRLRVRLGWRRHYT